MALFCKTCSNEITPGFGHCVVCNTGFLNQLVCGTCGKDVPRGMNRCEPCYRAEKIFKRRDLPLSAELIPMSDRSNQPSSSLVRSQMGLPGAIVVPEKYEAGKLGVSAVVEIPQEHANALNDLGKMIPVLHGMANKLIVLPGDGARRIARAMRTLATDIQEEIEQRVGPQS